MSEKQYMTFPALELRLADPGERIIEGFVVPWGEISYLTPDPKGERFVRGALTRTLENRKTPIKLFVNHRHERALGTAVGWKPNRPEGCWGSFRVRSGPDGDELLSDIVEGLLDGFSIGFQAKQERRSPDGVREVVEAALHEVSLVPIAAYDGARVLATREPGVDRLPDPPVVNLECLPPLSRL
jgi:HK97 family phage prohead protease